MPTYTLAAAARRCGVARTTLQRAVRRGDLCLTAAHRVDEAELARAGYLRAEVAEVRRLQQDNQGLQEEVLHTQQALAEAQHQVERLTKANARLYAALRRLPRAPIRGRGR
jgi:uncharacterized protein YlxW (UPF0749 family)